MEEKVSKNKSPTELTAVAEDNLFIETIRKNENGEEEVIDSRKYHNIIVDNAAVFQARRFQPTGGLSNGFQMIAVGTGYGVGSETNPEQPSGDEVELRNEVGRRVIDNWEFLHPTTGEVSGSPTNVLQIHAEFDYNEAVPQGLDEASLVEIGLFGGDATTQKDSGQLFAYRVFSVITKTRELKFRARWVITFKAR